MIVAWLRDVPDLDEAPSRLVREALRSELQDTDSARFGIVILHSLHQESVRKIPEWACKARVMVVLAPGLRLTAEMKWALLAAHAADVLDWPGEERLAEAIVPRIARWTEIEALMADDRVMRSAV